MSQEPVTKKLRFEVFKRDKFTCQYCGRMAPDVVLNADHIVPRAKGGETTLLNLITSCFDCNSGKKDRLIDDDQVLKKQQQQLLILSEKREQMEMMVDWAKELRNIKHEELVHVCLHFEKVSRHEVTDYVFAILKKLVRKYGMFHVLQSLDEAFDTYLEYGQKGPKTESVKIIIEKIGGVCYWMSQPESKRQLPYLYAIMSRRFSSFDKSWAGRTCAELFKKGVTIEEMLIVAGDVNSKRDFEEAFNG